MDQIDLLCFGRLGSIGATAFLSSMNPKIDYSAYSIDELLQAKRTTDQKEAPENYRKLQAEFARRRSEIARHREQASAMRARSLAHMVKGVAWFQMLNAVVFLVGMGIVLFQAESFSFKTLLLALAFGSVSFLAGFALLNRGRLGNGLTVFNQLLHLVGFSMGALRFECRGGLGVYARIEESVIQIATDSGNAASWGVNAFVNPYSPAIEFALNQQDGPGFFAFNFLALAILLLIYEKRRFLDR